MHALDRSLSSHLRSAARSFPSLVVTGPRRSGKTYSLRRTFPDASYHLLEDPDVLLRVRSDPRGWLEEIQVPAILDEIQNAPELFSYIRTLIDRAPRKTGQWILTGSQDFSLMGGVTESLAGRAAVFHLLPLSQAELGRWDLLRGGYPEVWARPRSASLWFSSYLETYLERDVRAVTAVRDLTTFRRFLSLVASRNGQILNKTDLASPLGVSVPTVTQWISVLETTGVIHLVPPYFENFEKRLVKTPKLYWIDTGLLCHLLGFRDAPALERSTFIGSVFEAFIASEIVKSQANRGRARELYYFRDQQGLEVDFLVPGDDGALTFLEVKWSRTPTPDMAKGIRALLPRVERRQARGVVVYRGSKRAAGEGVGALAPGVKAMTVEGYLASLGG